MSVNAKMTAIANEIRTLSGTTEAMGLDSMASYVGDANTEIISQSDLIAQIKTVLQEKTSNSVLLQDKNVSPSTDEQIVTPDNGYDGLSQVIVHAINAICYIGSEEPTDDIGNNGDIYIIKR